MNRVEIYLMQSASTWVSTFVLLGCTVITVVLVYSAVKAQDMGHKLINGQYSYQIEDM